MDFVINTIVVARKEIELKKRIQAAKRSYEKLNPRSNVTICVIGEKGKFDDYQSFPVHISITIAPNEEE